MQKILTLTAALVLVALIGGNLFHFKPFLSQTGRVPEDAYVAVRLLSPPAQGGYRAFKSTCSECHGTGGQGTGRGPRLTNQDYAGDFRTRPAFHGAVGANIPAHQAIMGERPGFNQVELMGKFLREMRQQVARRDAS